MGRRTFWWLSVGVALLAFGLREWYVLAISTPSPFQGDSFEYLRYAYNLTHAGVFSRGQAVIVPDDFRTPGYPLFLATLMPWAHESADRFVVIFRQAQVVLGTLTVAGVMLLARQWLPRGWALFAGLLIACWPHHVVASSSLLSEVVFGAVLIAALLCTALTLKDRRWAWGAGVAFALAYLVNPLIALFPFGLLVLYRSRPFALIAGLTLVAMVGWGVRCVGVEHAPSRAIMNFVQGSHPEYHEAYHLRDFLMKGDWDALNREMSDVIETPKVGWPEVAHRLASDPAKYARWYAIEKPLLLWDRDLQMAYGGIYFLRSDHSPFEDRLAWLLALYLAANPVLTLLLLGYSVVLLRDPRQPAKLCGLAVLYLTGIHVLLQAEPRYANAYRPLEAIVVAGGLCWAYGLLRAFQRDEISEADSALLS